MEIWGEVAIRLLKALGLFGQCANYPCEGLEPSQGEEKMNYFVYAGINTSVTG